MGMHVAQLKADWRPETLEHVKPYLRNLEIEDAKVKVAYNGMWIHLEGLTFDENRSAHITITPGPSPEPDWEYFHLTVIQHGQCHVFFHTSDEGASIDVCDKTVDKDGKLVNARDAKGFTTNDQNLVSKVKDDVERIIERLCVHKWAKQV